MMIWAVLWFLLILLKEINFSNIFFQKFMQYKLILLIACSLIWNIHQSFLLSMILFGKIISGKDSILL